MFTDRINRIQPSATLEMTSKAADLRRSGKPVYNMSVGEPDFDTPQNIQKAGIYAIQNGITKYSPINRPNILWMYSQKNISLNPSRLIFLLSSLYSG